MAIERKCGDCGMVLSEEQEVCPKCPPPRPRKKAEVVPALLVLAVLGSSLLMLSSSVVNVVKAPEPLGTVAPEPAGEEDRTAAAYEAAKNFVQQKFPGEKKFSELYQSVVQRNGDNYIVNLTVDDFSGPSPARTTFAVEMDYSNTGWVLKGITQ